MKITKLGHSCLLIQHGECAVLTDPGIYTTEEIKSIKNLDALFISDTHADHLNIDSIKILIANNPELKIYTQTANQKTLAAEGIESALLLEDQQTIVKGMKVEGIGMKHAVIHSSISQSDNTGYFFGERLFYPGDAFTKPPKKVEILALPVAGPWLKIADAIEYATEVAPKICFPVHDGILKAPGVVHRAPKEILASHDISFVILEPGKETEFA